MRSGEFDFGCFGGSGVCKRGGDFLPVCVPQQSGTLYAGVMEVERLDYIPVEALNAPEVRELPCYISGSKNGSSRRFPLEENFVALP